MRRARLASYALASPRVGSRVATMTALLALTACSITNDPAPLPLPPQDGGTLDGSQLDGGDAGDGESPDATTCRAREICFNGGVDDDCDQATDCDDLDCANEAACCEGAGPALFTETWRASTFGVNWTLASPADAAAVAVTDNVALSSFGADGRVRSLMPSDLTERCVPLALGARIEVLFDASSCTGACTSDAAVLLTGAAAPASGSSLAADLRVGVSADSALRVTSGSTSLISAPVPIAAGGRVVIEISPSVRDGVAVLSARVTTGAEPTPTVVVADGAFIAQGLLTACAGGPGLAIAVEGRGSSVSVGRLEVTPLSCTNPRVFLPGGNVVSAADVDATDVWTGGGISAPALLPETGVQHLFYDAADVDRDIESTAPLNFAIGAADAASFTASWGAVLGSDGMPGHAYLGVTPPACAMPSCATDRSVREPSASASYMPDGSLDGTTHFLAFARDSEFDPDVFAIEYVDAPLAAARKPPLAGRPLLPTPPECTSVRDPALAQAGATPASGLWLFYTCERTPAPSTIRAVALQLSGGELSARMDTDVEVLGPGIGTYAARGVRAPSAIVRVVDGTPSTLAVRLWFIARGSDGRGSLALAEGQTTITPPATAASAPIPQLSPYPANPLLRGDSPALGACDGVCDVRDVGIGRLPNDTDLTLLVARRVDRTAGGTVWELVPLAQSLEERWWGTGP